MRVGYENGVNGWTGCNNWRSGVLRTQRKGNAYEEVSGLVREVARNSS
jgi:hypothetical protein